jgi:hypothetical protein
VERVDEKALSGGDVTPLTEYCVRRFVASNWSDLEIVTNTGGRTLDSFLAPLQALHVRLVEEQRIDNEVFFTGTMEAVDENVEEEGDSSERIRLHLLRRNDAARVSVLPLPRAFVRFNANATVDR